MNILRLKEIEVLCHFDTNRIQEEIDVILTAAELLEDYKISEAKTTSRSFLSVYKEAEIDYLYIQIEQPTTLENPRAKLTLHHFNTKNIETYEENEVYEFLQEIRHKL